VTSWISRSGFRSASTLRNANTHSRGSRVWLFHSEGKPPYVLRELLQSVGSRCEVIFAALFFGAGEVRGVAGDGESQATGGGEGADPPAPARVGRDRLQAGQQLRVQDEGAVAEVAVEGQGLPAKAVQDALGKLLAGRERGEARRVPRGQEHAGLLAREGCEE